MHEDHKKDGDTEVSLATPTQRVDEWSEEFDKRFGVPCVIEEDGLPSFAPQIKSFIRENRAALLDRLEEEVGKLNAFRGGGTEEVSRIYSLAYSDCRSNILHIITHFKKE